MSKSENTWPALSGLMPVFERWSGLDHNGEPFERMLAYWSEYPMSGREESATLRSHHRLSFCEGCGVGPVEALADLIEGTLLAYLNEARMVVSKGYDSSYRTMPNNTASEILSLGFDHLPEDSDAHRCYRILVGELSTAAGCLGEWPEYPYDKLSLSIVRGEWK